MTNVSALSFGLLLFH